MNQDSLLQGNALCYHVRVIFFGHLGATIGAVWATNRFLEARERRLLRLAESDTDTGLSRIALSQKVLACTRKLDYRLVLVAAMLPDIIDKPIGQFFFREVFSYGRIFGHTLLFLLLISLGGFFLYRARCQTWLLTLSIGSFVHLVTDQIWRVPRTLFWPLLGFAFDRKDLGDLGNWVLDILRSLVTDPGTYVPELIGLGILAYLALRVVRSKAVPAFLKSGRLD